MASRVVAGSTLLLVGALIACETPKPAPTDQQSAKVVAVREATGAAAVRTAPDAGATPELAAAPEQPRARPCPAAPERMACVSGGAFQRGIDDDPHRCDQVGQPADRRSSSTPAMTVWVDTFYMDLTEVTVAAYRACVDAGKCPDQGPKYADFRGPKQPITGVDWFAARDYCSFAQKRLPTEAQWELAARGYEGDHNPWGNEPPDCDRAVIKSDAGRSCGEKKRRGKAPETGRVLEVGSRPPGRFGLVDMSGNVEEWVADWWTPSWEGCAESCEGENPRGPCNGEDVCDSHEFRVVRGGSWYWPAEHATGYHRRRHQPQNAPVFHHFGFRCARDLGPDTP